MTRKSSHGREISRGTATRRLGEGIAGGDNILNGIKCTGRYSGEGLVECQLQAISCSKKVFVIDVFLSRVYMGSRK